MNSRGGNAQPVGLVFNPHAGRDVRRLIAPAGSLTNFERTNVVRRVLVGLAAAGVRTVWYMPDQHAIVGRAASAAPDITLVPALETATDTPEDTAAATRAMVDAGVAVLVTHGGDGTNRVVATCAADVPLLPLAAGTNNVFPTSAEPTAAGFVAGLIARDPEMHACVRRHQRVEANVGDRVETALIDAAVVRDTSVGSRAVWEPERVVACMLTRATPGAVGLTGLAGGLLHVEPTEPRGVFVEVGPGRHVLAIIAPGRIERAEIRSARTVEPGERISLGPLDGTLTLDGERQFPVHGQAVHMTLREDGPYVVDVTAALGLAQQKGAFSTE